jgi:hypothetical protein
MWRALKRMKGNSRRPHVWVLAGRLLMMPWSRHLPQQDLFRRRRRRVAGTG